MNLSNVYKPEHLTELEIEYDYISEFLNSNVKELVVNGNNNSGRSTIIKLYIKKYNYDYLILDNYNLSKDKIIEKLSNITVGINRFFMKKKFLILFDNYDDFDIKSREYILSYNKIKKIIIANKLFSFKNYVKIKNYSLNYLINLYQNIFFLETGQNETINDIYFENINHMFSILELKILDYKYTKQKLSDNTFHAGLSNKDIENINDSQKEISNQKQESIIQQKESSNQKQESIIQQKESSNQKQESIIQQRESKNIKKELKTFQDNLYFDKFDYKFNDLVIEKNFDKKLYILDKIHNYYILQNNLIYNINEIDKLADCYENLSISLEFCNTSNYSELNDYYSILTTIGTTYKINDNFKIVKENTQIKKKKTFNDLHFCNENIK